MHLYLLLLIIPLGIVTLASYFVIRFLQILLKSRNAFIWSGVFLTTLPWCYVAIQEVNYIRDLWAIAIKSQPAVGADWIGMFRITFFHVPFWLVILAPSFPALFTALLIPPRKVVDQISSSWNQFRQIISTVLNGPYRLFAIGAVVIILAVAVRIGVWICMP